MKKYLISYANERFKSAQRRLCRSAYAVGGVDEVVEYDRAWLEKTEFYHQHRNILDQPRGDGYWLWKFKILQDAFNRANDDDVICYCDSGVEVINNLSPLFEAAMEHDSLFFASVEDNRKNYMWTKRDLFILADCDNEAAWNAPQLSGGFFLMKKNAHNQQLLDAMMALATEGDAITDGANAKGQTNIDGFIEHRHDQSIISLVVFKYGGHIANAEFREDDVSFIGLRVHSTYFVSLPEISSKPFFYLYRKYYVNPFGIKSFYAGFILLKKIMKKLSAVKEKC